MPDQPNPSTIRELERVMQEMQNLVDHPRIQQRTWVARAKQWLPILQIVYGELTKDNSVPIMQSPESDSPKSESDPSTLLVEVNASGGSTFVNVYLADVNQVEVYRGGQPGYRYIRGAHSGFMLKDGRKYLTNPDEAQRIVDAMRRRDNAPHQP